MNNEKYKTQLPIFAKAIVVFLFLKLSSTEINSGFLRLIANHNILNAKSLAVNWKQFLFPPFTEFMPDILHGM